MIKSRRYFVFGNDNKSVNVELANVADTSELTDEWALSKQGCFGKLARRVLGNGQMGIPTDMITFTDLTKSTVEIEKWIKQGRKDVQLSIDSAPSCHLRQNSEIYPEQARHI